MRTLITSSLLACAGAIPGLALAAGCTVSSTGLAFGRYQPLTFESKLVSLQVTSDATISLNCTGIISGGAYTIALGPSLAGSGDRISTRYLSNAAGGADMMFNVYRDPSFTSVFGDGVTAGAVLSGSIAPGDSSRSHTVYGRIPAGQSTLQAGAFSTTLTMTVSYTP